MVEVMAGAKPWSADGGDVGVLVLHGFTGNPVSLRPLAEALAGQGFAVELPLLPGHGTRWQDLQPRTWPEWAAEAGLALDRLRARTTHQVAAGLSMGATLALQLAQTRENQLSGLVLINPSVFTTDPRLHALPLLKLAIPSLPGIGNDIAKPGGDERPYDRIPLRALASVLALQARVRANLSSVRAPTLVFTSRQDHVVAPENSNKVLVGITSPDVEQVWLSRSYHVATLDHDADLIAERSGAFIRRVTGGPGASGARVSGADGPRTS